MRESLDEDTLQGLGVRVWCLVGSNPRMRLQPLTYNPTENHEPSSGLSHTSSSAFLVAELGKKDHILLVHTTPDRNM